MSDKRLITQLCLQFQILNTAKSNMSRLSMALQSAPFRSVIFSSADAAPVDAALLQPLISQTQSQSIAALVEGQVQLARDLKADGVHLPASATIARTFSDARQVLGKNFIVGADAGHSRHDAMDLAEAGADYVGFGYRAAGENSVVDTALRFDLAAWWVEIFEVPVMALDVDTSADVASLSNAGVDFVGLRLAASISDSEVSEQIAALAQTRDLMVEARS